MTLRSRIEPFMWHLEMRFNGIVIIWSTLILFQITALFLPSMIAVISPLDANNSGIHHLANKNCSKIF